MSDHRLFVFIATIFFTSKLAGRSEIIAILLGSGTRDKTAVELAQEILSQHDNDLHALGRSGVKDLSTFKGMGEAKSLTLMAALELGRRRKESDRKIKTKITSSQAVFDLLLPYFEDLSHEEFYVVYLNRSNVVFELRARTRLDGVMTGIMDTRSQFINKDFTFSG